MKYPINENQVMDELKVHIASEDKPITECEENLIRDMARLLNQAYADGVKDGIKK